MKGISFEYGIEEDGQERGIVRTGHGVNLEENEGAES